MGINLADANSVAALVFGNVCFQVNAGLNHIYDDGTHTWFRLFQFQEIGRFTFNVSKTYKALITCQVYNFKL